MPVLAARTLRLLRPAVPTLSAADKKRLGQVAGVVVGVVFLVLAVRLLQKELRPEVWAQVPAALSALSTERVVLAFAAAVFAYVWMGVFDLLSARVASVNVGVGHAVRTGFAGYALTHNLGLSAFTGMALRLHRYRSKGISGADVARVYLGNVVTMWSAFVLALGLATLLGPGNVWHVPGGAERAIGAGLVVAAAVWVAVCFKGPPSLSIRGHKFAPPTGPQALTQLAVGVAHWTLSAVVLWLFLPAGAPFAAVFAALCLGQIAVVVAHVPGGVGVLEGTLLVLLKGQVDPAALAAGVVLYRFAYYLLPLGLACGMMGVEAAWARARQPSSVHSGSMRNLTPAPNAMPSAG